MLDRRKAEFSVLGSTQGFIALLNLLEDRGQNGGGVTVLRRVFAVDPVQLLQAGQLQRVQVRRVVFGQMFVSLQLQETTWTSGSNLRD